MHGYVLYTVFLQTWFIGEVGQDTGGLTRELWSELSQCLLKLCEGQAAKLIFRRDPERVIVNMPGKCRHCSIIVRFIVFKTGEFRRIGLLVGMALIQGGSGFPYFSPAVYSYICGHDVNTIDISVDEVVNADLRAALNKVHMCDFFMNSRSLMSIFYTAKANKLGRFGSKAFFSYINCKKEMEYLRD